MADQTEQNTNDITQLKIDVGVMQSTVNTLAGAVEGLRKMHEDVIKEMRTLADFNKQLKFVLKIIVPLIIVVGIALGDKVKEIISSITFV